MVQKVVHQTEGGEVVTRDDAYLVCLKKASTEHGYLAGRTFADTSINPGRKIPLIRKKKTPHNGHKTK